MRSGGTPRFLGPRRLRSWDLHRVGTVWTLRGGPSRLGWKGGGTNTRGQGSEAHRRGGDRPLVLLSGCSRRVQRAARNSAALAFGSGRVMSDLRANRAPWLTGPALTPLISARPRRPTRFGQSLIAIRPSHVISVVGYHATCRFYGRTTPAGAAPRQTPIDRRASPPAR